MAYVKQVPAATKQLVRAKQLFASAQRQLAAEKKSPAITAAGRRAAQGAAGVARRSVFGGSRSDSTRARRLANAARAAYLNNLNAQESARILAKTKLVNWRKSKLTAAVNALERARLADQTAAARAEMAKLAAEQRALLRQRDMRLAGRITNNTTAVDLNSQRISLGGRRINAVEAAASSPKAAMFKPSAADKASAAVLEKKSKAISKKAVELAAVDKFATEQAALTRLSDADKAALKKSAMPALAGALIGFKVGGVYGAAIGAGAGFMLKGKGN